jgi:Predicted cation transporter
MALQPTPVDIGLFAIVLIVLVGPFMVRKIEHNLEAFLFVMGVLAVTLSGFESKEVLEHIYINNPEAVEKIGWHMELVMEAIKEPIIKGIVPAVLVAGLLFHYGRTTAQRAMARILEVVPLKIIVFLMVVILGLSSSIITAIIASLLLVELVNCMPLDRKTKINVVIIACFSIGLGAVLTPVGEPLSTIAITKLQGPPYHAGFFFLFNRLAIYVIPGCLAMGLLAMFFTGKAAKEACAVVAEEAAGLRDVFVRALKVYIFVMALLLLGGGMKIVIDKYLLTIPPQILYWVNMVSAILDNATLTAAELSPSMEITQIQAVLMGTADIGRHADPREHPEHHISRQAQYNEQGVGEARRAARPCTDGSLLHLGILYPIPHGVPSVTSFFSYIFVYTCCQIPSSLFSPHELDRIVVRIKAPALSGAQVHQENPTLGLHIQRLDLISQPALLSVHRIPPLCF